jgi:hypothetical protein
MGNSRNFVLDFLDKEFPSAKLGRNTGYIPKSQGVERCEQQVLSKLRSSLQKPHPRTVVYLAEEDGAYRIIEIET